jgi:NADPH:quinone reductase-like Zn-dependent oxidoreductase
VIVGSEVRGRWLGGFDRNLRAVALSRLVGQRLRMLASKPRQEDLQTLGELLEAGKVTPVIDRTYPLREVPQAIRYLVEGHGGGGKIVVTV